MSRKEDVQRLIVNHQRRWQKLKEQQAVQGQAVEPQTVIEIEDIEVELENLQAELAELEVAEARAEAPVVYIHNFGDRPKNIPAGAYELDWDKYFAFGSPYRKVPQPDLWRDRLLPELAQLQKEMGQGGLIRLRTSGALSVGFAFGYFFREVGQYQLDVAQFPPTPPQFWYSDKRPPSGSTGPRFVARKVGGSLGTRDAVVIVYGTPGRSAQSVARAVGNYLGEQAALATLFEAEPGRQLEQFKGLLFLEATAASQEERFIEDWEAVALARTSRRQVVDFVGEVKPETVHLFLAVPFALAVFLGHQWNAIGKQVQGYEWIGDDVYAPSFLLNLS